LIILTTKLSPAAAPIVAIAHKRNTVQEKFALWERDKRIIIIITVVASMEITAARICLEIRKDKKRINLPVNRTKALKGRIQRAN